MTDTTLDGMPTTLPYGPRPGQSAKIFAVSPAWVRNRRWVSATRVGSLCRKVIEFSCRRYSTATACAFTFNYERMLGGLPDARQMQPFGPGDVPADVARSLERPPLGDPARHELVEGPVDLRTDQRVN